MLIDVPAGSEAALSRVESYHQTHYYEQLTDCVSCLFDQQFTAIEIRIWCEQLRQLFNLSNSFLDDMVKQTQEKNKTKPESNQSSVGSTAHWFGQVASKMQSALPFNLGYLFFTAPIFNSVKLISQVTEVAFSRTIHQSISNFLFSQFKQNSMQGQVQDVLEIPQSLVENSPLGQTILDESRTLSKELLKLFMFREMLLQGKLTMAPNEPDIRMTFLKQAKLKHEKEGKIAAIIEIFFIQQLNQLFEQSFKHLFELQQRLIKDDQNEFDRWLNGLFESSESRQFFSRQIQLQFFQATRDFFLTKKNEPSLLGKHPYLFSIAIGLTVALLAISTIALISTALSTLPLLSTGISAFALVFTASILLITKLNRVYYDRSPKQRGQIQRSIDILNQNITHIHQSIENSKQTANKELNWLERFETMNKALFNRKHIMLGYHEAWVREYAARYRHAKAISSDLRNEIVKLVEQSFKQSEKLIDAFRHPSQHKWYRYLVETKTFIEHQQNQTAIEAFELRLKIREQVLHLVLNLPYIPHELSLFYTEILGGQSTDLAYIQHFYPGNARPYQRLCQSAQQLYRDKEASQTKVMRFNGDPDYRALLKLPNVTGQSQIMPSDISTYLRNSLHFLLSLTQPIKPGLVLDPLEQPIIPTDEYFIYRMMWFRQLAKLYFKSNTLGNQSNRLYIESFVQDFFEISAKEVFDDILNQSIYLPTDSQSPQIRVGEQKYVTEQLDYIIQSLTLDIACHTKPLKPLHILTRYSQDYQEAIERKEPIKLIALNLSQSDLSIQQSHSFETYINQLINDTQGYINYLKNNGVPETYIDCYQFNMIKQLITLQLEIIIKANESGNDPSVYSLVDLWNEIDSFLSKQPYRIPSNSELHRLFELFRKNPENIYAYNLIDEKMATYKKDFRALLLLKPSKSMTFSMHTEPSMPIQQQAGPTMN